MQNKTDNLTADIKKLIADIEQVDWKDECWPGYEQQAEENQESVLWNLTEAYNLAKKGNYDWAVEYLESAWSAEMCGEFEPFYTEAIYTKYCKQ